MMKLMMQNNSLCLIISACLLLWSTGGFSTQPITTTMLLKSLKAGEPWDRSILTATKAVMFSQSASSGTDATEIAKIQLGYFTSDDCSGALQGSGFYTTPDGTSFSINVGAAFGLTAAAAWNVGDAQLSIADMTTIGSIAMTFRSTNNNTPQSNFSNSSFVCVPVTCTAGPSGTCISGSSTQSFELKTTAAIGDPADGGIIACMNGGLNDLVVPAADNDSGIVWAPNLTTTTGAISTTDGASNTATIVAAYGASSSYAARICSTYTATGGYTSGWFLPAGNNNTTTGQLNCLDTNQVAIGGFNRLIYWSSTEVDASEAWRLRFDNHNKFRNTKDFTRAVRCARAFAP
jgi:hypothetical protein